MRAVTRRVAGSNVALPKITLGTSLILARPSWIALALDAELVHDLRPSRIIGS